MADPVKADPAGSAAASERSGAHVLEGLASAEDSARLIRNYRYAVERMMRILGGWIALTPELSAKLLLGRHVWDSAQHADMLGKRLAELRARAQVSEAANAAFVAFMNAIEEPERPGQTVERLVGMYGVLKPHLLATYDDHLSRVNEIYEPPTQRILARLVDDERRHISAGRTVLEHILHGPGLGERAQAWQERLEGLLRAAGGVTGVGLPAPARAEAAPRSVMLSDDPRQFIRLEESPTRWPVPEALDGALRAFGDAMVARDGEAVNLWLLSDAGWAGAGELFRLEPERHRVVAFAKIGDKRAVKIRVEGAHGAATLLARWALTASGWRAELIDVVALDLARAV